MCAAAKAALSPADRERLCAKLTMGRDIFYKRAAVGADGWMNDSGNARHLPLHSFSTMYEIKLMEIPERHAAIEAGVINPSMTRVDLERWNEERAARTSPTGPTKPPKASAIPYASILFVEPVSADGVRRVDGLLAELRVLPGVKVSLSQKPTERQYERAVRRWESRVEAVKRRLVRQAVKTELEHDLGRKPKGVTKAEYLLSLGHDPADYEVPKNADDEHLMHVLDHFNRSAQFEDMCRQCAVPPLRHLRANRRSDRSWLRLD